MKESLKKIGVSLLIVLKWGVISSLAFLISTYIINQLPISNNFLVILLTAMILSIVIQIFKSHEHEFSFKLRWFIFYFLVYTLVIWLVKEYILSESGIILSSLLIGFFIASIMFIVQRIRLRSHTIPWISIILILVLLVSNLSYLQSIIPINLPAQNQVSSTLPENKQSCPTPILKGQEFDLSQGSSSVISALNLLIDTEVWRKENSFSPCYKGKYSGQYPDWLYCDNLIVSRWEITNSGTIDYRFYAAVTAELKPQSAQVNSKYVLNDFVCENGQKIYVNKQTPEIYKYDSRDGKEIRVVVSEEGNDVEVIY